MSTYSLFLFNPNSEFAILNFANDVLACQIKGAPANYPEGVLPNHAKYWRPEGLGGPFDVFNSIIVNFGAFTHIRKITTYFEFVDNRPLSISMYESMSFGPGPDFSDVDAILIPV